MSSITISGVDECIRNLDRVQKELDDQLSNAVRLTVQGIYREARRRVPKRTRALYRAIKRENFGLSGTVWTDLPQRDGGRIAYAVYVEYGSLKPRRNRTRFFGGAVAKERKKFVSRNRTAIRKALRAAHKAG